MCSSDLIDLATAIEVSCNYYFYEVAYRLGLDSVAPYAAIESLTKYVQMFGLDRKTGIELAETAPNVSTPKNLVTTKVNSLLNSLLSIDTDQVETYVKNGQYEISQNGFSLPTLQLDSDQTLNNLLQKNMENALDGILKQPIYTHMEELMNQVLLELVDLLNTSKSNILDQIVTGTMNDTTESTLKNKVHTQFANLFASLPHNQLQALLVDTINAVSKDMLLDAYERAYHTTYTTLLDNNTDKKSIEKIKECLANIDANSAFYTQQISLAIEDYIIDLLLDSILEKVSFSWNDGVTVRTAIGQGNNAFSPVQMSRYIASLANGKEVLDLSILKGINDYTQQGQYIDTFEKVTTTLPIATDTIKQIHEGMLRVTSGESGTAQTIFKDVNIQVAGKTGTAEEGKHEHSWFVGFAPYENPEIAIVTTIYNADGLSRFGTYIAKDILEGYFDQYTVVETSTLNSIWSN